MLETERSTMKLCSLSFVIIAGKFRDLNIQGQFAVCLDFFFTNIALINTRLVSAQVDSSRVRPNLFDPVLSANSYIGHIKENEGIVQIQPRLYASDADPLNTLNGLL